MALTYKISESGLYKIVEVVNDGEVIGRRKFLAKEIDTVADGSTVQLKDVFTGEILFSGSSSSFVKSDGTVFGDSAANAVSAMNTALAKVKVNIEELDGFEVVSGGVDLTEYVKNETLDAYKIEAASSVDSKISTAVSPINTSITSLNNAVDVIETDLSETQSIVSTIPQIIAQIDPFTYSFIQKPYTAKCKTASGITFTVPANGKIRYTTINHRTETYGLAGVQAWITTAAPPTSDYTLTIEPGDTVEGVEYLFGISSWTGPNLDSGAIGLTGKDLSSVKIVGESTNGRELYDEIITGLTPGETMTVYMWAISGVFGITNSAVITFDKGITIYEVLD